VEALGDPCSCIHTLTISEISSRSRAQQIQVMPACIMWLISFWLAMNENCNPTIPAISASCLCPHPLCAYDPSGASGQDGFFRGRGCQGLHSRLSVFQTLSFAVSLIAGSESRNERREKDWHKMRRQKQEEQQHHVSSFGVYFILSGCRRKSMQ
jgi:hypothetical protein